MASKSNVQELVRPTALTASNAEAMNTNAIGMLAEKVAEWTTIVGERRVEAKHNYLSSVGKLNFNSLEDDDLVLYRIDEIT